jgi:hypothetical protein
LTTRFREGAGGNGLDMNLRKVIERSLRRGTDGDAVRNVNAAVAANIGEPSRSTHVSSKQRIVQRDGRTEITTEEQEVKGGAA